jgi:hypothetical protein
MSISILFEESKWAEFAHAFADFLTTTKTAKTGEFRAVRWEGTNEETVESAMRNFAVRQIKSGNGVLLVTNQTMILNAVGNMPTSLQEIFNN